MNITMINIFREKMMEGSKTVVLHEFNGKLVDIDLQRDNDLSKIFVASFVDDAAGQVPGGVSAADVGFTRKPNGILSTPTAAFIARSGLVPSKDYK
jgi:hypothetical protein